MKLLISQKNELFDLINSTDSFSPSQFEILETKIEGYDYDTKIQFKNSEYFFLMFPERSTGGRFYSNFSPGEFSAVQSTIGLEWIEGKLYFTKWLQNLQREITAPNKWDKLLHEISKVSFYNANDESKFSHQEYIELVNKMDILKDYLFTIPLPKEQTQEIIEKLSHITTLAENLNKFDWKNLFIGTIMSLILQLSLTQENVTSLWALIKKVFSSYFLN